MTSDPSCGCRRRAASWRRLSRHECREMPEARMPSGLASLNEAIPAISRSSRRDQLGRLSKFPSLPRKSGASPLPTPEDAVEPFGFRARRLRRSFRRLRPDRGISARTTVISASEANRYRQSDREAQDTRTTLFPRLEEWLEPAPLGRLRPQGIGCPSGSIPQRALRGRKRVTPEVLGQWGTGVPICHFPDTSTLFVARQHRTGPVASICVGDIGAVSRANDDLRGMVASGRTYQALADSDGRFVRR